MVAAPLKPIVRECDPSDNVDLPRPKGRGPIEAQVWPGELRRRRGLPRPKGRGPIEATMTRSRAGADGLPFRDRKVAAPLKPGAVSCFPIAESAFRDRKVAAPLKLGHRGISQGQPGSFRDRKVAAPLKLRNACGLCGQRAAFRDRKVAAPLKRHVECAEPAAAGLPRPKGRGPIEAPPARLRRRHCLCLPRPKGRGPIEADIDVDTRCLWHRLPRPKGRGPIEAGRAARQRFAGRGAFRDRKVAAPLKLCTCWLHRSRSHRPSATERSRPH